MREILVYTCGNMGETTFDEQIAWRTKIENLVQKTISGYVIPKVTFIHPPIYYNYEEKNHKTEREILDWEMMQLHKCDVLVVNFDKINTTTGSHMELGAVNGINRFGDKYIFVIGFGKTNGVHPWILESCNRIEDTVEDVASYISNYIAV